jgi:hypothetical protein
VLFDIKTGQDRTRLIWTNSVSVLVSHFPQINNGFLDEATKQGCQAPGTPAFTLCFHSDSMRPGGGVSLNSELAPTYGKLVVA